MHKEQSAPKTEAGDLLLPLTVRFNRTRSVPPSTFISTVFISFISCPRRYFYTYRWQGGREATLYLVGREEQGVGLTRAGSGVKFSTWPMKGACPIQTQLLFCWQFQSLRVRAYFDAAGGELSAVLKRYQRN